MIRLSIGRALAHWQLRMIQQCYEHVEQDSSEQTGLNGEEASQLAGQRVYRG